jgi:hypothetical protein
MGDVMELHHTEPLAAASLTEIETEVSDVLDALQSVQQRVPDGPIWDLAETVKGLAWAVGSLSRHHENLAVKTAEPSLLTTFKGEVRK